MTYWTFLILWAPLKITFYDDYIQKYPIKISDLNIWTLNLMNQLIEIQWKSPKLLSQLIRKRYYTNLGTSLINSLISPPFLI